MAKFIVHNPNTEEDSYKIASLLFMSANILQVTDIVDKRMKMSEELKEKAEVVA